MLLLLLATSIVLQILLLRPRPGVLSCGLFGGSFNRPLDETILGKLKILGFFNQSRGEHSCGYYNGEEVVKGVDKHKKWFDLMVDQGLTAPGQDARVFIGHTRHATYGAHTADNAHPFQVEDRLVMAHNGTLQNHWTLCNKHGIPTQSVHVDSHCLALLIDKLGFEVLADYKGAAAVLAHRTHEPDTLYIFHGASREYEHDQKPYEERPLFYLKTEEGVYVSSIKDALSFIRTGGEEPQIVPHNQVYALTAGQWMGSVLRVERENQFTKTAYQGYYQNEYHTPPAETPTVAPGGGQASFPAFTQAATIKAKDIEYEYWPERATDNYQSTGDYVYYWRNRYYHGNNMDYCHGIMILDEEGRVLPVLPSARTNKEKIYYFHQGVMLDGLLSFNLIDTAMKTQKGYLYENLTSRTDNFARYISKYAAYPVTNVDEEAAGLPKASRELFYLDGMVARNSYTPKWSERNYHYKNGFLVDVTPVPGGAEQPPFFMLKTAPSIKGTAAVRKPSAEHFATELAIDALEAVYLSEDVMEEALLGVPTEALKLYCRDVAANVFSQGQVSSLTLNRMVAELLEAALQYRVPVASLLDTAMTDELEDYVEEAVLDEQAEAAAAEEEEAVEEIISQVTAVHRQRAGLDAEELEQDVKKKQKKGGL